MGNFGYIESSGGKLRDELLNRELFLSLEEARWVIDRWQLDDHHHIHRALDYQTAAEYAAGLHGLVRIRFVSKHRTMASPVRRK